MIPAGIYDNHATMRRETYGYGRDYTPEDAVLTHSVSAQLIETKPEFGGIAGRRGVATWGTYPELPGAP